MAGQTQQSGLFKKYAARMDAALQKAVETPVDLGKGPSVTPGQNNSIGQVTHCGFQPIAAGKTNAGEPLFRIAGVCIEGVALVGGRMKDCRGEQTSQLVTCCDTGTPGQAGFKSFDDNLKKVVDLMRAVTNDEFVRGCSGADLEGLAKAIEEAKPFFRFSTSVRAARDYLDPKTKKMVKSEEGVWENWHDNRNWPEATTYVAPDAATAGVRDASPSAAAAPAPASRPAATAVPATKPAAAPAKPAAAAPKPTPQPAAPPPPPPVQEPVAAAADEPIDISALVAQAVAEQDNQVEGTDAQTKCLELATQLGCYDAVFAVERWEEAEAILLAAAGTPAAEVDAPWTPEVGQIYGFRTNVIDPATKQTVKAAVKGQYEIASVSNGDVKTVTLKDATSKRLYTDQFKRPVQVPWTELESAE